MSISVTVTGTRNLWFYIDGNSQPQEIAVTGTSRNNPEVVQVPVDLQPGNNIITFFNGYGWAPDVDALAID